MVDKVLEYDGLRVIVFEAYGIDRFGRDYHYIEKR